MNVELRNNQITKPAINDAKMLDVKPMNVIFSVNKTGSQTKVVEVLPNEERTDFSQNGIIYYLATHNTSDDVRSLKEWRNPTHAESKRVSIFTSTKKHNETERQRKKMEKVSFDSIFDIHADRLLNCCTTGSELYSYIVIDFSPSNVWITPTHYSLRHTRNTLFFLRSWNFDGRIKGMQWKNLMDHVEDESWEMKPFASFTWKIPLNDEFVCNQFRITCTNLTYATRKKLSVINYQICISGFEVYGTLFFEKSDVQSSYCNSKNEFLCLSFHSPNMDNICCPNHHPLVRKTLTFVDYNNQYRKRKKKISKPCISIKCNCCRIRCGHKMCDFVLNESENDIKMNDCNDRFYYGCKYEDVKSMNCDFRICLECFFRYKNMHLTHYGILSWIGENYGQNELYENPAVSGLCKIIISSNGDFSQKNAIIGRDCTRYVSAMTKNSWISIDLGERVEVCPSHYSLRHYSTWHSECLRNWIFLAFDEELGDWIILKKHKNDQSLNGKGFIHCWKISDESEYLSEQYYSKFKILQTGVNSSGNLRLALSGFELYGKVKLYSKIDTNLLSVEENKQESESQETPKPSKEENHEENNLFHRNIVQHIGEYFILYQQCLQSDLPLVKFQQTFKNIPMRDIMNDYSQVVEECNLNVEYYESMEKEIRELFLTCDFQNCSCIERNFRDQLLPINNKEIESSMDEEVQLHLQCKMELLDAFHCTILHGYDSGYVLRRNEVSSVNITHEEDDERKIENQTTTKILENANVSQHFIVETANSSFPPRMQRMRSGKISKFVTQITLDKDTSVKNITVGVYSFGYEFKYWEYFRLLDHPWMIPKKFESLKEELLLNDLLKFTNIKAFDITLQKGEFWMTTLYVKTKVAGKDISVGYYSIRSGSMVTLQHILSILFYCNFTNLCEMFSSTYRRISPSQKDYEIKERHSNFREWGRLLFETVNIYGTSLGRARKQSLIFYHGISEEMIFESCDAQFLGPTSTTSSFTVARRFAKTGIILELSKGKESHGFGLVKFFNCEVLSIHSNEREMLFCGMMRSLPFVSIRHVRFNEIFTYKVDYISPIICLRRCFEGKAGKNLKITEKRLAIIKILIEDFLQQKHLKNETKNVEKSSRVPEFIRKLFAKIFRSIPVVQIDIRYFNITDHKISHYFSKLRPLLCICYDDDMIEEHGKEWRLGRHTGYNNKVMFLNTIECLDFNLIGNIMHGSLRLTHIIIKYLPLRKMVLESVLKFISEPNFNFPNLHTIRFVHYNLCYPKQVQLDARQCMEEYQKSFKKVDWVLIAQDNILEINANKCGEV